MAKKNKAYVVWEGKTPGIYNSWDKCKKQVDGQQGAKYKGFPSLEEAETAFSRSYYDYIGQNKSDKKPSVSYLHLSENQQPLKDALSVDAACSGNPGKMEYRGVDVMSGAELFKKGPFENATNNIGEFLALVHGLALLKKMEHKMPIYSDSKIAMAWVKGKKCKTKLEKVSNNTEVFELVRRAEIWLKENSYTTKILKWETKLWGEIPADFGRK